jgi:predicted O-methyltransferase YrrM
LGRIFTISPSQIESEIVPALELAAAIPPRNVLEIGTSLGGTLFLLARVSARDATIISMDLPWQQASGAYSEWREKYYRSFGDLDQRIRLIRFDSHSQEAEVAVGQTLNGTKLDLLFIDGDHSYEGVRADLKAYGSLVKPGGFILLHDINPDSRARYGKASGSDSGEVFLVWQELKIRLDGEEFIENEDQDGYGIGVIRVTGERLARLASW